MSLLLTLYIVLINSIEFEQVNADGAEPLKKGVFRNSCFLSKFVIWNPWKIFVKEFSFSKILEPLPVTLLKQPLYRYFSKSSIINFRIPILTERLSVGASKISKFFTSFMKSVLVCWSRYLGFYQNVLSIGVSQKIRYMTTNFNKIQN